MSLIAMRWLAGGFLLMLAFGGGWSAKAHYADKKYAALVQEQNDAVLASQKRIGELTHARDQATAKVEVKYVEVQGATKVVTKEIIRNVPVYITAKADRACPIPAGFVQLHDAAASGNALVPGVPDPSNSVNDTPTAIALSTVAGTVASNYGTCHETANQLIALQEWLRAMAH